MLKKLLRVFLWLSGLLFLLVAAAVIALTVYLNNSRERLLAELSEASGLEVTFREVNFRAWSTFPQVSFALDSLTVRDPTRPLREPALLAVDTLSGELSLAALLRDTLRIHRFDLKHGHLHLAADTADQFNVGKLFDLQREREPTDPPPLLPQLSWQGIELSLENIDFAFHRPVRNKRMELRFEELFATGMRAENGALRLTTTLATHVKGIAFNTEKGSYLKNTPVSGALDLTFGKTAWTLPETALQVGPQQFLVAADINQVPGELSHIRFANDATHYEQSRALLHDTLQSRLAGYYVSETFPATAEIITTLEEGADPEIRTTFRLAGQDLRLLGFPFTDVHTSGTFVNRLAEAEGGLPGSQKNMVIELGDTRGYQDQLYIQAAQARVRATEGNAWLQAPLRISGPTATISQGLGNTNFFFRGGRFFLKTNFAASLNDLDEIVNTSDFDLRLQRTAVTYAPAGIRFPFKFIQLDKREEDISFQLQSGRLKTGFTFGLEGKIDNLLPLLVDRPGDSVRAAVNLHAPRLDWTNFLAIFGEDGYLDNGATPPASPSASQQPQAMKQALLGLQHTFHPKLDLRFDTLAYYDVFQLTNFSSGLRFKRDTLMLERTAFNWGTSEISFGAGLAMSQPHNTPFRLQLEAKHLNLNRLRPSLEYFGLQLPAGIDSLPNDLHIDFAHQGVIDDSLGIKPNLNAGRLVFDDGSSDLFHGSMQYQPGANGLQTMLHLDGDPSFVNHLFSAKDFLFGGGRFDLDLQVDGTPRDLPELIEGATLRLTIDSSRLSYRPGKVVIPIQQFTVNVQQQQADYHLQLLSNATSRSVEVRGHLDHLPSFLYPQPGQTFRVKADASAAELHWSDFEHFLQRDPSAVIDTSALASQHLMSATEGIFQTFRPDLSLRIDTFHTGGNRPPFTDLFARLGMRDTTLLVLENTGFRVDGSHVALDATYRLDERRQSPFALNWQVDSLALGRMLAEIDNMNLIPELELGMLRGNFAFAGSLTGRMDERNQRVVTDSLRGTIHYSLSDFELANWPQLAALGKKAKMKKRFEHLRFGPLQGSMLVDSGRIYLSPSEIQSTALQLFVEGYIDLTEGPDLLVSIPLRNIGRGRLHVPPEPTGFALAGRKVFLVSETGKDGTPATKFRLGRRRYYKDRGRLTELLATKTRERAARRTARARKRAAKRQ